MVSNELHASALSMSGSIPGGRVWRNGDRRPPLPSVHSLNKTQESQMVQNTFPLSGPHK